ncbi:hypothetical protein QEN19_001139 [Hanseniaspora menglaensis]
MSTVTDFKNKAAEYFKGKQYDQAIEQYNEAIKLAQPSEIHVLYSNRSACYASLLKYQEALEDAKNCVAANPEFVRGYGRLATAQTGLQQYEDAISSYKQYLELQPGADYALNGLKEVQRLLERQSADASGSDFDIGSIMNDPEIMQLMQDPAFMDAYMKQDMSILNQPKYAKLIKVLQNLSSSIPKEEQEAAAAKAEEYVAKQEPASQQATSTPEVVQETELPEEPEVDEEAALKNQSIELKLQGNVAYKKKDFETAVKLYQEAFAAYPDVVYLNNIAAAYLESSKVDEAIHTLNEALELGKINRTDYKTMAKIYHRLGNCYIKLGQGEEALSYLKKSLTEERTPEVLNKIKALEKQIKLQKETEYIDVDKANEASDVGKKFFSQNEWPKAIKQFDEAIKRNPDDYRHYSNRAACLAKLLAFPDCIKDCDKVISMNPSFIKAYIRKANAQAGMQKFVAADRTIAKAVALDIDGKNAKELVDAKYVINNLKNRKLANGSITKEQLREQALEEPEIREIVSDPVMVSILEQAKTDPQSMMTHYGNPEIKRKIDILIECGIIGTA